MQGKLNLWEVMCIVKFTSKRLSEDIYTDIRALKGVTIVNSLSQTSKTTHGESTKIAKLHVKFTPGEVSIQKYVVWLKNQMDSVEGVFGAVLILRTVKYIGRGRK
jgi:hypothetical protein